MNWPNKYKWYIESDTGHRISKTLNSGKVIYTAWPNHLKADTKPLDNFEHLEDAKQRCEQHHNQSVKG